jgi:PAS domain S-box-containing protein
VKVTKGAVKKRPPFGANSQNLVALVRASPLGIVAIDLDGTIVLWNRAAEEIMGWREEEVLGLPIGLFTRENWEGYEVLRRRTLNREVFHSLPMDATRKDGRRIVISYSSAPVCTSGKSLEELGG